MTQTVGGKVRQTIQSFNALLDIKYFKFLSSFKGCMSASLLKLIAALLCE